MTPQLERFTTERKIELTQADNTGIQEAYAKPGLPERFTISKLRRPLA